jgi:hypothetical protein
MPALTAESVLPWLQKNKEMLNLAGIATAGGISPVTLRAYVGGDRTMPAKVAEQLVGKLNDLREKL